MSDDDMALNGKRTHELMSKIADTVHASLRDLVKMYHVTAVTENERMQASYAIPFGALMGSVIMTLECTKQESWDDRIRKVVHDKVDQIIDGMMTVKKAAESTEGFEEKASNIVERADKGENVKDDLYALLGLKI